MGGLGMGGRQLAASTQAVIYTNMRRRGPHPIGLLQINRAVFVHRECWVCGRRAFIANGMCANTACPRPSYSCTWASLFFFVARTGCASYIGGPYGRRPRVRSCALRPALLPPRPQRLGRGGAQIGAQALQLQRGGGSATKAESGKGGLSAFSIMMCTHGALCKHRSVEFSQS